MASLIILFIPLMILMFASLHELNYLLSPSFAFIVGFVLQVFFCFFYTEEWSINLSSKTVGIILLGCFTFFITSWMLENSRVRFVVGKKRWQSDYEQNDYEVLPFEIETWKLIFFIIMQLLTLAGYILFMNSNMVGGNLAAKIYYYRSQTADYGKVISIPKYLSFFRLVSSAIGYSLAYVLAYNMINKYNKNNFLVFINLVLSLFLEGILGARGGMFNFIVAFFGVYFLLGYKYNKIHISFKLLVRILIIGIAIIGLLPILGNALGRPLIKGAAYDTAMYFSGSLINLDMFVKTTTNIKIPHISVFYGLLTDLNGIISKEFIASQKLPTRWNYINGNSLGNVYTTFSSYWYDIGWLGVILYSMLSAIIMHSIAKIAQRTNYKKNELSISTIMYSYFIPCIMFSFFANRFYAQLCSLFFLKFIVAIFAVKIFIERLSFFSKSNG